MRRTPRTPEQGTALIITVGLLAVLAVIGFGFAVLARLHHDISGSYRASAQSDLISKAAINYAVGDIRSGWANAPTKADGSPEPPGSLRSFQAGAVAEPIDSPASPWFVDPGISNRGYEDTAGRRHYCNLKCNSYALVHEELGPRVGVSNAKVFDCAGKLNINDRDDTNSDRLKATMANLFKELFADMTAANCTQLADDILAARNALPDKRFASLDQLRTKVPSSFMDARRFEALKHYLTIYSWPHMLPVVNGEFPYEIAPTGSATGLVRLNSNRSSSPAKFYLRSPININTAGKELLYAVFRNIVAADGTQLTVDEARKIAEWIQRRREPEKRDYWPALSIPATWWAWVEPTQNPTYREVVQRKIEAWRSYPIGPFDSWNEVADFFNNLTNRSLGDTEADPIQTEAPLTAAKAEACVAATSPNATAAGLAGYNTWHLGYSRTKKVSTSANFREQIARDKHDATCPLAPHVTGKHQIAPNGDTYPLCFSSLGRFEIYSRTYTFLKVEQGACTPGTETQTDNTFTDTSKTWTSSPSQYRGYSLLVYAGKGKGQLRGIVYIRDKGAGTGNTLITDRWSVRPDGASADPTVRSRYYIVGPGPLLDRVPTSGSEVTVSSATPHLLTDSTATWQDDQWNGHRILTYRGSLSGGVETIDDASIQERTIIDTDKASKSLILAPALDTNLMANLTYTAYMILGCDGVVEHSVATKAYDVIHHTTQHDFELNRPAAPTGGYTYAATGPNGHRAANGTVVGTVTASKIDGWIAARKFPVVAQAAVTNPMLHNFTKADLEPDSGGTFVASNPVKADIQKDALSANGLFLSDGIHLTGGSANYADFKVTGSFVTDDRLEGGFVSFWLRPNEDFLKSGTTRTILKVFGKTQGQDEITLLVRDSAPKRVLEIEVKSSATVYEQTLNDGNHKPLKADAPDVKYKGGTARYTDTADISTWKPGEWHHIAFAWYECIEDASFDTNPTYNTDSNLATRWQDDDLTGEGGKLPNYILDDDVQCAVRVWVDGTATARNTSMPAFNFYANAGAQPADIRLSGDAAATIDGLCVGRHTDKNLPFTVTPPARYDGFTALQYAEYQSPTITLSNPGGDLITLGTVNFTGFLPFIKEPDRWGGPGGRNVKFPIRVQVGLSSDWSNVFPENGTANTHLQPVVAGGALVKGANNLITTSGAAPTIQYRLYLYPCQGTDTSDTTLLGLLKGRQTPVVEDVTITYLGPVVYYYWQ